jgi:cytochrome c oxidase subunit 1
MVSSAGSLVIAISMLVFAHNFWRSWKRGEVASGDPWDGRTLEWSIPSPPPEYNFREIPTVHSRDAFWHQKYTEGPDGRAVPISPGNVASNDEGEGEAHGIHMPSPSYFPPVAAFGLFLLGVGLISHYAVSVVGTLILLVGVYGWTIEPATEPDQSH